MAGIPLSGRRRPCDLSIFERYIVFPCSADGELCFFSCQKTAEFFVHASGFGVQDPFPFKNLIDAELAVAQHHLSGNLLSFVSRPEFHHDLQSFVVRPHLYCPVLFGQIPSGLIVARVSFEGNDRPDGLLIPIQRIMRP